MLFRSVGIGKGFIVLTVNDQRVDTVEAFEKVIERIMQQHADDKGLFIKGFYPNGKVKFYAIDLNE